jgi:hypothetical protein
MKRRDFLKYSTITSTTIIFPELLSSNDLLKIAKFTLALNPIRFIAGLIFDNLISVYIKPLIVEAYNDFCNGKNISKNNIQFYSINSPEVNMQKIAVEPYKASIVTYSRNSKTDYKLNHKKEIDIELLQKNDIDRFYEIHQYMKDNKLKIKLYNSVIASTVGNDLTPSDLFNIDYIAYGNTPKDRHIQELLKITDNSSFGKLIV